MLHIVCMILKIAGILLVSILGLILLLLLIVLLVPVRYRVKGIYEEKPDVNARISWLFSILLIRIRYDENGTSLTLRICGIPLKKKAGKPEDETEIADKAAELPQKRKTASAESEKPVQQSLQSGEPEAEELIEADVQIKKKKISIREKIHACLQKIKCTILQICDRIKEIGKKKAELQAFMKDERNKEAFRLIKGQLIYLWKHIRPRKLSMTCHFGFEDPALTGQVLAAGAFLYPLYRNKVSLYPDFNQKILTADVYMRGRIRIFPLLLIIIRLWKNKQIRTMVNKFMK